MTKALKLMQFSNPLTWLPARSLRLRLIALWLAVAAACGVAALLMWEMFQISVSAQVDRADVILGKGCASIAERYRFYAEGWRGGQDLKKETLKRDLTPVVSLALRDLSGVEGGIWQTEAGPLAYAFPTYEGGAVKTDIPAAEFERIKALNQNAAENDEARQARYQGRSQTLLLRACPLPGPIAGLTSWSMTRVFTEAWEGYDSLRNGLLFLFACAVTAAVLVTRILTSWSKHIRAIEQALSVDGLDLPPLPMSGEQELDRIIGALNEAGDRLGEARRQSEQLNRQVATAERLASIGRLAAGLAHEIRNPIAAMRLKAENALAKGSQHTEALNAIIEQIDRLDRLVGQILTASGKDRATPTIVAMMDFLAETLEPYQDLAKAKGLSLRITGAVKEARLDPGLTRRALENLITNAIQHTGRGGQIALGAKRDARKIIIEVADTGPGVAPEIAGALFEPFVSGRDGGTGLGLAIAREAIESQGGHVQLVPSEAGAIFQIGLPG
ncbi:MAG: HAMP domain-containing sensor histidine kinase [Rhodomicrobium sp.]